MKRISIILLALALTIGLFGCARDSAESGPFTDEFFADVVEIGDIHIGRVSGEQMEQVIQYLKGLNLTETDEHLSSVNEQGELFYGSSALIFYKSDGSFTAFCYSNAIFTNESQNVSYRVTGDENLNAGLKAAFGVESDPAPSDT